MGVRTRSANSSPVKQTSSISRIVSTSPEAPQETPRILIAPANTSPDSRILLLKHPRDATLQRFLFCPKNGLFEVTKFSGSANDLRSVLFTRPEMADCVNSIEEHTNTISRGYISKDAEALTATPFDLSYFLLQIFVSSSTSSKRAMFQPLDDIFEIPTSEDKHLQYLVVKGKHLIEEAMANICDTMEAGDETLFRYSEDKVFRFCIKRARQVVQTRLPASMEERFVTRALEAPVLSISREEGQGTTTKAGEDKVGSPGGSFDSQSTAESSTVSQVFSEISSTSTHSTPAPDTTSDSLYDLQRLRTALKFISASCLPRALVHRLGLFLNTDESQIDFEPLDVELKRLACLRAEAAAQRSLSDFSRKRSNADDEEAAELRAEKKRKFEEDEKKRKANESRGVRDLKKVNVSGMKKMSDFFAKKPVTAKSKT